MKKEPVNKGKEEIKKNVEEGNSPNKTENGQKGELENNIETDARRKEFEFQRFCFWLCMPTMFKGKDLETLQEKFFIDDEEMLELCSIKTQGDFAIKYNVHHDTLTDWKRKAKQTDLFKYVQDWAKTVNKNVVASAYRSAMSKDPKAFQDRKLMLQLGGWSEEQTVNVKGEGLFDILKKGLNIQ